MKAKSSLMLLVFIAIAIGLSALSYFGIGANKLFGKDNIKLGLDLSGGVNIVFEAKKENPTAEDMRLAVSLLRGRLDRKSETEAEVSVQGTNRIRVDMPGYADAEEAVTSIGKTAQLMFADKDGNVLLTGSQVKNAYKTTQKSQTGVTEIVVVLEFNPDGAIAFETATGNNIGKPIYILLDEEVLSSPVVNQKITGDSAIISGDFNAKSAEELASLIKAGSLPFDLEAVTVRNVGARLGAESLATSVNAGAVGFILILVLMIVLYRLSGIAADIALFIYLGLELIILSLFEVTLTLPGIAGIVLSVGMAVDANIIIFERIKDEMGSGKTLKAACDAGFKRALPAIIDSNITTIIASLILFWLGTGPVKGFAQTLTIGVLLSMFTAITVTKNILAAIIGLGSVNPKLYGGQNVIK